MCDQVLPLVVETPRDHFGGGGPDQFSCGGSGLAMVWAWPVFADDREMSMSELRRRTPLSQSRVSRLGAGLEATGLAIRVDDSSDTRAVNVRITDDGVAAFRSAQDRHLEDLEQHFFAKLIMREIQELANITSKLLDGSD